MKKKGKVTFTKVIQDSQDFGSDDEHKVSRVFFDLHTGEDLHPDLYSDIKQVVGSSYETGDIEVSAPIGYRVPFNYTAFRDAVEAYYRGLVKLSGGAAAAEPILRVGEGLRVTYRHESRPHPP